MGSELDVRDQPPLTKQQLAAIEERKSLVAFLLNRGADANARDRTGQTPLHCASRWYFPISEDIVTMLLRTADVNERNDAGRTPLHVAVTTCNRRIADLLVRAGADINARDADDRTPLHLAVLPDYRRSRRKPDGTKRRFPHHESIVSFLLSEGADIHAADREGVTPLDMAKERAPEDVAALIEQHAAHRRESGGADNGSSG